jgi:hypothetical protein
VSFEHPEKPRIPGRDREISFFAKMESLAAAIWLVANYVPYDARVRERDGVRQFIFYAQLTDRQHDDLIRHVSEMIDRLDFLSFAPTGPPS